MTEYTPHFYPVSELSKEYWTSLVNRVRTGEVTAEKAASQFATQIRFDNLRKIPSAAAMCAPLVNSGLCKRTRIGRMIAYKLTPPDDMDDQESRIKSYIAYTSKRRAGRQKYMLTQALQKELKKVIKKTIQSRKMFNLRKKALKISDKVLHPTAMPVGVAPLKELDPFYNFLRSSTDVEMIGDKFAKGVPTVAPKIPGFKEVRDGEVEFTRGVFYKDGRIDLCKQEVGPHIGELLKAIRYNPNVKHYLFGNNVAGGSEIAKFITEPHLSKIQTWYIAGNDIGPEDSRKLGEAFKTDKDAKAVWLKRNPMMPEGVRNFCEMLRVNRTIEVLDLFNVGMLNEGLHYLCDALKQNDTLRHLYIGANGLSDMGPIADYYNHVKKTGMVGVQSLKCVINRFGDEGCLQLADALSGYVHLKRISMASNRVTEVGAVALAKAVSGLPQLKYFDLGHFKSTFDYGELPNHIGNKGGEAVAEMIVDTPSLLSVNIFNCGVGLRGLRAIADAIPGSNVCWIDYKQYDLEIPKEIKRELFTATRENYARIYGEEMMDQYGYQGRLVRSGTDIEYIDSVYRNRLNK